MPQIIETLRQSSHDVKQDNSANITFQDIITGQGWIEETIMFYGHYEPFNVTQGYSMKKAYFYTNFIIFLGSFLFISVT